MVTGAHQVLKACAAWHRSASSSPVLLRGLRARARPSLDHRHGWEAGGQEGAAGPGLPPAIGRVCSLPPAVLQLWPGCSAGDDSVMEEPPSPSSLPGPGSAPARTGLSCTVRTHPVRQGPQRGPQRPGGGPALRQHRSTFITSEIKVRLPPLQPAPMTSLWAGQGCGGPAGRLRARTEPRGAEEPRGCRR